MFEFLKRKRVPSAKADPRSHDVLARAAAILELQLSLCKSTPNYAERFNSDFVRGYLVGFFDAAIQHADLPARSDDEFFVLISVGHAYLLPGDTDKAGNFALDSLARQADPTFSSAQRLAGEEYFDYLNGKIRNPRGLESYFYEGYRANA